MNMTHSTRRFLFERFSCGSFLALILVSLVLPLSSAAQTWTLSWSDEFNGAANSPIDPTKWQYDTGILNVNNEVEYYCAPGSNAIPCVSTTPNAYIDGNGHLVIQAIKINSSQAPYSGSWTSARLNTANNLLNFQYGRLESSMALPIGAGIWPAYWALGTNISSVGWPMSGEIDFMENVPASGNLGPNSIRSTLHGGNSSSNCYCGNTGLGLPYTFPSNDVNGTDVTTFHTYGAIWSTNMVQFYVDDPTNVFLVRTANDVPAGMTWDFNHPFFVLLNLAIGGTGSWPGPPDNTTPNPAVMTVDYVRWYQPASAIAGPSMSGTAITTNAGIAASSAISLNSSIGSGRVYLSCTTTAPKATCAISSTDSLNPYTVDFSTTASASATANVTTTSNSAASLAPNRELNKRAIFAGSFEVVGFLFVGVILLPRKWRRGLQRGVGSAGLMMVLLIHPGCGGGSSSSTTGGGGTGGSNGTTPGNYTVTVNVYTVSNSSGNPDSSTTIPLTVN